MLVPINNRQSLELIQSAVPPPDLLASITLSVDNLRAMKKFLTTRKIQFTSQRGVPAIDVLDPDGHLIHFELLDSATLKQPEAYSNLHIIHAGFIVRNRAAMEHFYKDILGFRPYWHGGMKDAQTDWISLQVPDGTDWIEFMVNVPENADQRLRGIMNHIALGVTDIQAAREQLVKNGVHLTEEPKLGRDGKWQLNVYDPDQTRIEFMEFTPKEKPCCSEFTGPHPKP